MLVLARALHESCSHKVELLMLHCASDQHVTACGPAALLLCDCGGLQSLEGLNVTAVGRMSRNSEQDVV